MAIDRTKVAQELAVVVGRLGDPALAGDHKELGRLAKQQAALEEQLALYDTIAQAEASLGELAELLRGETDPEMKSLAEKEQRTVATTLAAAQTALGERQQPVDERADKNAIMEIRAGAGGDESSLFAGELYAMYVRYAESQGWAVGIYSSSPSDAGGYKEIVFEVSGRGAYGQLQFEAGTHRVQRVPATESQGRIHTSTVTVAVLPEAEEADVTIQPEEIRIDVFRSSGPGGQSVNTTDSAVRITHLASGLVVSCQDEKSQHKNRAKALAILRTRLQALADEQAAEERGAVRRAQVGTGERSEKIRTYNFPQDRLTDHRIGYTAHGLDKVLAGHLGPLIEALREAAGAER